MSWVEFEDFERAREWINEPQPHQVESASFYDDEGPEVYADEPQDELDLPEPSRLDRLDALRFEASLHVLGAMPGTEGRRIRQARLSRIAAAHRAEREGGAQ